VRSELLLKRLKKFRSKKFFCKYVNEHHSQVKDLGRGRGGGAGSYRLTKIELVIKLDYKLLQAVTDDYRRLKNKFQNTM